MQIIFFVRSFDIRKVKGLPENMFDEAWFRLQNVKTSQTLDYTKINKLPLPEGFEGEGEDIVDDEDEENGKKTRNEVIYIAGRVYREDFNSRSR